MIRLLTSNEQLFRQQRNRSKSLGQENINVFMPGVIYVDPEIELQSIVIDDSVKKDEEVVSLSKSVQTETNNIDKKKEINISLLKIEFVIGFIECLFVFGFLFESKLLFTIPMSGLLMFAIYLEYVRRMKDKIDNIVKNDIKIENKVKSVGNHRGRIKFLNTNKKNKKEDNNV
jgi:hypothetical protein